MGGTTLGGIPGVRYGYCHGFASGPRSGKAQFFRQRLGERGIDLHVFDFNLPSFATLTVSRSIGQVKDWIAQAPAEGVVLIGSSLGGWLASWVAQEQPQVKALVLLAPAFEFMEHWWARLSEAEKRQWQTTGVKWLDHYGFNSLQPLHYGFVTDAQSYDDRQLTRPLPTLILHGIADEIVPIQASQRYAASRPWVKLVPLAGDHGLKDCLDMLWQASVGFLAACPEIGFPANDPPHAE
ncbi:MAG: YqiA/YcfP family alpha/beta fold hydrolase [Thermostichales cyanobacterium DRC_bins_46]